MKAEVVAHLDLDKVASWSTDSFSESRLAEIRDLAQTLDVHRAIIAPRSVDGGEMLNLVRTLKAVGVRVSVLPRLLEVVGSSVEFDDLHGVTVMGVRRFDLTRSSAAFKRPGARDSRALRILAKTIYRELRSSGYEARDVMALAGELLGHVTSEVRAKGGPRRR